MLIALDTPPTQPVASLELQRLESQWQIRPCFSGQDQHVHFELDIELHGRAGVSHSRQKGTLRLASTEQCPATNRQGWQADQQIAIRLRWWLDGQPQAEIFRQISASEFNNATESSHQSATTPL
ncbi:hypothetical protein [Aquipseudomonas ullengensis]|uniref:Uncharacterized protein n=1 Tax=Aquipseudomonas ullengensis TaxID=2759166 RepID=A0A7W4LM66_9GAMM|nr:hypothetical protein [Pseudomonas ullengensis]MBB2495709.1 hypothetical protein [Pseudomonas ullengensis]